MKLSYFSCVCVGLALASAAVQAGPVGVSYVHPETFTDVQDWNRDTDENLQTLTQYFQWLGKKYLPPEQSLQIEVLDIDLAGKLRGSARWGMVRVVGRPLDWPQMTLRYRLEANGAVLASGQESLSDMAYAANLGVHASSEPLAYEKHMLKNWFRNRFVKN